MTSYELKNTDDILTPALLIYPEIVETNIQATVRMLGGDADRWRPHVKSAKLAFVIGRMIAAGVRCVKCATTLELLTSCEAGAADVLLAFPVTGANARRTLAIAQQFPDVRISVLVESAEQAAAWIGTRVGIFIDVNPGMNRTGIGEERAADICALAQQAAASFRGVHYYDGQISGTSATEAIAHAGYDKLTQIVAALDAVGCAPAEVITSGTPATPFALTHAGLSGGPFRHRLSPGTLIYNDMSSLGQLPGLGFAPAVMVLTTVISHPAPGVVTCDAGHKAVSADAGVPTCEVWGRPDLKPLKPSEEHLPIAYSGETPAIGSQLYLLPRHVCPTVNNFDAAAMVTDGEVRGVERVTARGHEGPYLN